MPPEYTSFGIVSEKTDAYSYGMVLLEILTGATPRQVCQLYHADEGFFKKMHLHVDQKAGEWPARVVKGLATAAESCLEFRTAERATVRGVLPAIRKLAVVKQRANRLWSRATRDA